MKPTWPLLQLRLGLAASWRRQVGATRLWGRNACRSRRNRHSAPAPCEPFWAAARALASTPRGPVRPPRPPIPLPASCSPAAARPAAFPRRLPRGGPAAGGSGATPAARCEPAASAGARWMPGRVHSTHVCHRSRSLACPASASSCAACGTRAPPVRPAPACPPTPTPTPTLPPLALCSGGAGVHPGVDGPRVCCRDAGVLPGQGDCHCGGGAGALGGRARQGRAAMRAGATAGGPGSSARCDRAARPCLLIVTPTIRAGVAAAHLVHPRPAVRNDLPPDPSSA